MSRMDESDDSSSSDTDQEMDDSESLENISKLKSELSSQPKNYDLHVKLVGLLKNVGDITGLREAMNSFSEIYPLSPALWLSWIEAERSVAASEDEKQFVKGLFDKALEDYQDVDLWLEYCNFALGNSTQSDELDTTVVECVLEQALTHQGLNFAKGVLLWDMYREFQKVVLALLESKQQSTGEQIKKMDKLYRRQLRVPQPDLNNVLDDYRQFLVALSSASSQTGDCSEATPDPIPSDVKSDFEASRKRCEAIRPFEDAISDALSPEAATDAWLVYLNWAVKSCHPDTSSSSSSDPSSRRGGQKSTTADSCTLNPNELCCLFERAVTDNCLDLRIWLAFIDYLEEHISSDRPRLIRLLKRASRNLPWSIDIWLKLILALELDVLQIDNDSQRNGGGDSLPHDNYTVQKMQQRFAEVKKTYQTILFSNCLPQAIDMLRAWQAYCDFHVRRLSEFERSSSEWDSITSLVRQTFDQAVEYSTYNFGAGLIDPDCDLLRYYAYVEAKHIGDLAWARSCWTKLMKLPGHGSQSRFWLAYMQFEHDLGDVKHLLQVCNMAVNSVTLQHQPDLVFHQAIRLTCQLGVPLAKIGQLERRIRCRRKALQEQQQQSASDAATASAGDESAKGSAPANRATNVQAKKRKQTDVSNLPAKKPRQLESTTNTLAASERKTGETVVHDSSKDDRTVFVSNLAYSVCEDALRETFSDCGSLNSIRLVRDYAGRSKGYAYVEFTDPKAVAEALLLDRHPVKSSLSSSDDSISKKSDRSHFDRPMFVSVCNTGSRSKTEGDAPTAAAFRYAAGKQEPEKLFVRNLDRHVGKAELQAVFGKYGTVVDIRLATYRNGQPKGHAYVEFTNADDASKALVGTDNMLVGQKRLSVAISNPPARAGGSAKSSGEGGASFAVPSGLPPKQPARHARTQLDILPRAIHKPSAGRGGSHSSTKNDAPHSGGGQTTHPDGDTSGSAKSNEDFRKMFLSSSHPGNSNK